METIFDRKAAQKADAAKFRSLSGKEAAELHKGDRTEYLRLRAAAQAIGDLGPASYVLPGELDRYNAKPSRVFTMEEIQVRSKHSEADVRKFFQSGDSGSKDNAGQVRLSDPARYKELRAAAVSYGLLDPLPVAPPVRRERPVDPDAGRFPLSEDLCTKLNLPVGTKVDADEFVKIVAFVNEPDAAKKV
jgi:hypothetical protein